MYQTKLKTAFQKYWLPVLFFIVGIIFWSLMPKCTHTPPKVVTFIDSTKILKEQIKRHLVEKDSLKVLASRKDSIHFITITKYIKDKQELAVLEKEPCDSVKKFFPVIVNDCDSIIAHDSDLIHTQRDEQIVSDNIIREQAKIIVTDSLKLSNDSLIIKDLTKQVKQQKRRKNFFKITTLAAILIAIFK